MPNPFNQILKIAVADDHSLFRESICALIDTWDNCKVIVRAGNGKELIESIHSKQLPDLVITDLAMPVMNGYETIEFLHKNYPEIKILVVSQYQSDELVWQLIKTGAHGFVYKSDNTSKLKKAIREILVQGYFFTDHAASRMVKKSITSGSLIIENDLEQDEMKFLQHICSEKTYKEIADKMNISERQVEYLRYTLFERFSTCSRTGLAVIALQKGLAV